MPSTVKTNGDFSMFFERVYEKGLAMASYVVGCQATGESVVIDPKRDIDTYLHIARREGLKITHVTETHIHADYLSGSRELAHATGAQLLLSDEGGKDWAYQFPHSGLRAGDQFSIGNLKFKVLHVPGHTPEHIAFLLTDVPAGDEPIMFFSGDFVFVGSIGRPDLLEKAAGIAGTQEAGARDMFNSLKQFSELPDYVQVWPGHGAGSACGKALGAVPASTVGYEKRVNWAFQTSDEVNFVQNLLDGQPEPPRYFATMKKMNREGAPILGNLPKPDKLDDEAFKKAFDNGMPLVDCRGSARYAAGYVPGSLCIQGGLDFSNWAGWLLDYDKPFMLLADDVKMDDLVRKLVRIGLDNIHGYINSTALWTENGGKLHRLPQISVSEAFEKFRNGKVNILDVRSTAEYLESHVANSIHIHLGYLNDRLPEIPADKPMVLLCASGTRSTIAGSLLARHGLQDLFNLTGGIDDWKKSGLPVVD